MISLNMTSEYNIGGIKIFDYNAFIIAPFMGEKYNVVAVRH